ncbi:hypothetical protein FJ970_18025 [Mesorhizobium sp. B2-1-8]|uniref:hypothetical protein n=1 Tax=Mesorhizobium sp. B2-1-8 TaxID=2589967 RepID=UPI0011267AAE|nr:hypothetical protein [Mesorhizobium sp. B2-1-8]UCI17031.1 hypothetical protein FJ970_18025 [Mesorhizobium sp. B2-1-8]
MSGILSAKSFDGGAVIVLTDGALYDRDGVLLGVQRKVAVSDRLPLAVAFRGNVAFGETVSQRIILSAEAIGFDRMLLDLDAALPGMPESPNLEILIAGVSESAGPVHRMFQNRPVEFGCAPSTLIDPGPMHWGFGTNGEAISLQAMGIAPPRKGETMQAWLARHAVAIFENFRRIKVAVDPFDDNTDRQHLIGGVLDMTVVSPSGVTITQLHRWPDKVGMKIDPLSHNVRRAA